jgi:hypothetical protein
MDNQFTIKTYRYLRLAMVMVTLMLLIAVVVEWRNTKSGCWQESISAYYYTPVQSVFVGALITIGVCMVALRGLTDEEDILMNLGGMLAPVVALVPTPGPGRCRSVGVAVTAAPENIQNNMIALFIIGALSLVAAAITLFGQSATFAQFLGYGVAALIFLGAVGWFVLDRSSFDKGAHYTAAIPLFASIVVVVILNSRRDNWSWRYMSIAVLMVVGTGVLVAITFLADWDYGILVAEALLIVLFAVFWMIQTVERWNVTPAE